jgi:hypothetical protein
MGGRRLGLRVVARPRLATGSAGGGLGWRWSSAGYGLAGIGSAGSAGLVGARSAGVDLAGGNSSAGSGSTRLVAALAGGNSAGGGSASAGRAGQASAGGGTAGGGSAGDGSAGAGSARLAPARLAVAWLVAARLVAARLAAARLVAARLAAAALSAAIGLRRRAAAGCGLWATACGLQRLGSRRLGLACGSLADGGAAAARRGWLGWRWLCSWWRSAGGGSVGDNPAAGCSLPAPSLSAACPRLTRCLRAHCLRPAYSLPASSSLAARAQLTCTACA